MNYDVLRCSKIEDLMLYFLFGCCIKTGLKWSCAMCGYWLGKYPMAFMLIYHLNIGAQFSLLLANITCSSVLCEHYALFLESRLVCQWTDLYPKNFSHSALQVTT